MTAGKNSWLKIKRMREETQLDTFAFVRSLNAAVQALERIVQEIAPTNLPVLLVGESGTGKEVFALQIHRLSARSEGPLVKMRCASFSADSLLAWLRETEGRSESHDGAGPGSVFFDEIAELDEAGQRLLLSALPDGEALPRTPALEARTIFSTCRDLEEETQARRFRSDLYYRINGVRLWLPPLRRRKEDIPALLENFLTKYATVFGRPRMELRQETLDALLAHSWPGNIRELENVVKKMVALGDEGAAVAELVTEGNFAPPVVADTETLSLKTAARAASFRVERELILKTLARTRWNRKRAAEELQISYKSLLCKLKQIRSEDPEAT
jgi:two-component system response regulator AtoC